MALSNINGPRKGSRYHRLDDIPKDSFTPRTYQIELLDAALKRNTILCLGSAESKIFLALMVAKQLASVTRHPFGQEGKRTFYLTDTADEVNAISTTLPHHTDLSIGQFFIGHHDELFSSQNGCTNSSVMNAANVWQQVLEANSIIVTTGSIFLMGLQNHYITLQDVNLLIFDDCHKTVDVESHPYTDIVSQVASMAKGEKQPHILGVTASIAGTECSKPESLQHTISSMEKSMLAYAETSMLILSERFGCRPKEYVIRCQGVEDDLPLLTDELEDLLLDNLEFFEDCCISKDEDVDFRDPTEIPIKVLVECHNILQVLGSWCTSSVAEYFLMQLDKIIKFEKNDIHKKFLRCVSTALRRLTKFFERNFKPDYDVDEFLRYTTSKVRETANILRNYKPEVDFMIINNDNPYDNDGDSSDMSDDIEDDEDSLMSGSDGEEDSKQSGKSSKCKPVHIAVRRTADGGHERVMTFSEEEEKNLCGVVFVKNHFIAFGLNKLIEEICSWDEKLCFVKSSHIMGHGLGGGSSKQKSNKTYKRQEETLRKFRMQEINLIIATKELEEGIDIPKSNLVVCFDPPTDYRSYTFSKGRARARDASFYILLDEETHSSFSSNLNVFKGIEQVLLGENRNQNSPLSKGEENRMEEDDLSEILPPYCSSCAYVDMRGAIALINKYCAKLPSDAFTHLTPQCRLEKIPGDSGKVRAYLRLPINSPVKEELQGPIMPSCKLAERAVALKMCEILHKKGELDEHLVPVGKEMFLYEEEEEWADEEDQAGEARPGTTKRKQYYAKKVADALIHSQPKPGQSCFLYLLNLQLTGRITDEQNTRGRVIYAPEDTTQTLGVLLSKRIPQIPCFPIYTRSGEVTVSVDLLESGLNLSDTEIDRLLKFHRFVFSGVLHLIKEPMEFCASYSDVGCIIVPLDGTDKLHVDWDFVDKVTAFSGSFKRIGPGKQSKKEDFDFCTDDFKDAVVMPSYRNLDQPQHFYVAEIRHDLNPVSPFPSPELYKTFQDYYTTKYGLVITCTKQPLLDVDHTTARLNLLTPRYMNQKGVALPTSSAETKRARRENLQQKQILVPELCDVHVFPASLWRKTVCLPAILYRTNCLLLAEELRRKISKETGIGIEALPNGFRFPKLDFGFETSPEKLKEAEATSEEKSLSSVAEDNEDVSVTDGNEHNAKNMSLSPITSVTKDIKEGSTHDPGREESSVSAKQPPMDSLATHKSSNDECNFNNDLEMDVADVNLVKASPERSCQPSEDGIHDISSSRQSLKSKTPEEEAVDDTQDHQVLSNGIESETESKFLLNSDGNHCLNSNHCLTNDKNGIDTPAIDTTNNYGKQTFISVNCNNFDPRQQKDSSKSLSPDRSMSIAAVSHHLSDSSPSPSTKEEAPAQATIPLQSNSMCISDVIDATIDFHVIKSSPPSSHIMNSAAQNAFAKESQSTPMQSLDDVSNNIMKNGLVHKDPSGAINNVLNNQVLCASPSISLQSISSDSESFSPRLPSSSSSSSSLSPPSSSALSPVSEPPHARSTITSQAAVTSCSPPGHSTKVCSVLGHDTPSLQQRSADSSKSSSFTSTAAADNDISGFCQYHNKENLNLSATQLKTDGAPQQNGNPTLSNDIITSAYQGCEHGIELSNLSALNHSLPWTQEGPSQIVCDKNLEPANGESEKSQDSITVSSSQGENSLNEISPLCHDNHEIFEALNDSDSENNHKIIKKGRSANGEQPEIVKRLLNGYCPGQNEKCDRGGAEQEMNSINSAKAHPSMSQSVPQNNFEPAIIMNTLSAELNSQLKIDLIASDLNNSSPTFHSSESLWNDENNQGSKEDGQQSKQYFTGGWDQGEEPPVFKSFPQSTEHSSDVNSDSTQLKDSGIIKFSFSGEVPKNHGENKDLVIDTWKSEKEETKAPDAETCVTSSFVGSQSPENSKQPCTEKDTASTIVENKCSSEEKDRPEFPIVNVWKVDKPCVTESEGGMALEQGSNLPVASSSSSNISLDEDRDLSTFIGPSPCLILQALTMSNANDFFSLERLETIGDSFLKYAITVYLYCSYPGIHEGKLSYLRSKQVSNYNLYRLGRRKNIAEYMVSTKFEPYENWLPPGFVINNERRRGPVPKVVIVSCASRGSNAPQNLSVEEGSDVAPVKQNEAMQFNKELEWIQQTQEADQKDDMEDPNRAAVPYSLQCHHGLPDKSVADCVEALIGCYLTTCGRKAALMFMSWLGLKVLPKKFSQQGSKGNQREKQSQKSIWQEISEQEFDELQCPPSPMFMQTPESEAQLNHLLEGFESLEEKLCYKFRDRSYLLQAFTHASYHYNSITDCYQRIEFLGDAILDYVITRHLYEDSQKYSPGILTDLRSALVNNNIFAALAVKWGFHCYFKAISPSLFAVIDKFVTTEKEKSQDDIDFDEEYQELSLEDGDAEDGNEEDDNGEEVEMEIPKALGDIFESVAGAIYLDSGMSLDAVWRVYYRMMKPYIDKYLKSIPKSLVRELLEREPETAKFERPERTINGKVRVTVNVVGKGVYSGIGRNYRIAKSAAAKKALRALRSLSQNGTI